MNISRAQVELSSKCNFRCVTCRHGYDEYGQHLPDAIYMIICNELLPTLDTLELQGTGESLLSPHISDMISNAVHNNVKDITLITNASLLSEAYLRQFVGANVQLVVSLDGPDAKTFSMHRPVGNFDSIVKNLMLLNNIRKENSGSRFSFTVNMVLTRMNYRTIPKMIGLLSEIGADHLFVSEVRECMPDKATWEALNILDLTFQQEFTSMLTKCASLAQQKNIGFAFNPNKKTNKIRKKICEAPWGHVFISADGEVSICCELSKTFGNLANNSLSQILACGELQDFRNNMLLGKYDSHCLNCCLPWGLPYE